MLIVAAAALVVISLTACGAPTDSEAVGVVPEPQVSEGAVLLAPPSGTSPFTELEQSNPGASVTDPWSEYVAIIDCGDLLALAGLDVRWFERLSTDLGRHGSPVCSFQTPEILSLGAANLPLPGSAKGDVELQIAFFPRGLSPESSGLPDLLSSGGALMTLSVDDGDPEQQLPAGSDTSNARGGWIEAHGGLPGTRSVLSRISEDRLLLRWTMDTAVGADLRVSLFVEEPVASLIADTQVLVDEEAS